MDNAEVVALLTHLRRIADALEEMNRHTATQHADSEETNRLMADHAALGRRQIEAAELHNKLHLAGKAHVPQS